MMSDARQFRLEYSQDPLGKMLGCECPGSLLFGKLTNVAAVCCAQCDTIRGRSSSRTGILWDMGLLAQPNLCNNIFRNEANSFI